VEARGGGCNGCKGEKRGGGGCSAVVPFVFSEAFSNPEPNPQADTTRFSTESCTVTDCTVPQRYKDLVRR
jgi:hypothetical protein